MKSSLLVAAVLVGAALLALEVGISSAIVEIVAGIVLASISAEVAELHWLKFLANLGMLSLMFMAGFEVEAERLRKTWRASLGIGALSFLLPLAGVFSVAHWVIGLPMKASGLVAIGLSTTSLALVYQALRERDLLDGTTGQTILAAASVVDVLSMISLALLLGNVGWGTAIFVVAVVPMLFGLPKAGKWLFRRYKDSVVEMELRFILVLLVAMGFMAEEVGIHPAIVAFMIGLVMSEVVEEHGELEEKLKGIVFSFFAPVFFLHAGTLVKLSTLSLELLGQTVLLFITATALKFIGTALPSRQLIETTGTFAGLLFNYRLTFGIISASVGLSMGLLSDGFYTVMLLVVVASAVLPVVFLRSKPREL